MGAEMTIVGAGLVAFLFVYIMSKLDDKHFLLKTLLLLFSSIGILLIGQGVVNEQYHCSWLITNSTSVSSTITSYAYTYQCDTATNFASNSFYKLTLWFFRILLTYSVVYLIYAIYKKLSINKDDNNSWLKKRFKR